MDDEKRENRRTHFSLDQYLHYTYSMSLTKTMVALLLDLSDAHIITAISFFTHHGGGARPLLSTYSSLCLLLRDLSGLVQVRTQTACLLSSSKKWDDSVSALLLFGSTPWRGARRQ